MILRIIFTIALFSIIILFSQFVFRPTPGASGNPPVPPEKQKAIPKNISLSCPDCEQPNVTATLLTIFIPEDQTELKDVTFRFQFDNATADPCHLKFNTLKLIDPDGFDLDGQGDPFSVGPDQSAIANVYFPGASPGIRYTLRVVVEYPHNFVNSYLDVPISF